MGFPTSCERRSADITIHWWPQGDGPIEEGTPCMCGERRFRAPESEADE